MEKMSKQIIPLLRPGSREMERIVSMADTRYILLQITDEEIELGQFAEERLYAIAEMTQAGIVYADYREEKAGELDWAGSEEELCFRGKLAFRVRMSCFVCRQSKFSSEFSF